MLSDIFHTNGETALGTLTLTANDAAFVIMELGSRRVRLVDTVLFWWIYCPRGCLSIDIC
jgi:hypothetical protein